MIYTHKAMQIFAEGRSYWQLILTSGKSYSEIDHIDDPVRGRRALDWHLDIAATGDTARIAELWLHTPQGPVALRVWEPHSAYIFNTGLMGMEGRSAVAQVIGRVDDKEQGTGIAFIWDVAMQQCYRDDQAGVRNFAAWRPGIIPPGALNLDVMEVRL